MVARLLYASPPWRQTEQERSTVTAEPVQLPITETAVAKIASRGYPLWESLPVMQLRNRRVTVAYADLSKQLAGLTARTYEDPDAALDANWCTFATWSSKTIGANIEEHPSPDAITGLRRLPRWLLRRVMPVVQRLLTRSHGASFRSLAAGNRFVFLEVGTAVARFVDSFDAAARAQQRDEQGWNDYWTSIAKSLSDLRRLDASWLSTKAPDAGNLQLGLRRYYEALFEDDVIARQELVFAGNAYIGAYEQQRVDGYLAASLALFSKRAMRHLVQRHSGKVRSIFRRVPTAAYAWCITRYLLVLETPGTQFRVGRPLPQELTEPGVRQPQDVTDPSAQALLTRFDSSEGDNRKRRARNWTWFDDRMNYIINLFWFRQRDPLLFSMPFHPDVIKKLLSGQLAEDAAEYLQPDRSTAPSF